MFDIVMPLFNKEAFVGEAIESVLAQTFPDWRLFVVDDGSSDESAAVVERFGDPRIRLLRQKNAGPGAARNAGIAAGDSEWISVLDADDIWFENHLQVLDRLRAHFGHAVLIGTGFEYWTGGRRGGASRGGSSADRIVRYFREFAKGHRLLNASTAAFSRRAVEEVGPFKPADFGEDTEMWARLALHGPVAVSTDLTVLYRVQTGGLTDHSPSGGVAGGAPFRLNDVCLPIATLLERLPGITDRELRRDILDYIDQEVGAALIRSLRAGQIDHARRLAGLFLATPRGKVRIAALLAGLPPPIGQRTWILLLGVKRAARVLTRTPVTSPDL